MIMPNCQLCGQVLTESNIGYVCVTDGARTFECRVCHTAPRRIPKVEGIKAWRLNRPAPRLELV
jgi:hypothetical protein